MRRNPFTPGAGTPPPVLAGRSRELQDFEDAILSLGAGGFARSVLLTGLRGVGKTVPLGEYARLADANGWAHARLEAGENLSLPAEMAALARKALIAFSRGEALARWARRALGALKSFRIRWHLPEGGDLEVGVDPVAGLADSGLLHHDLGDLFGQLGEAARQRGVGILVTLDELQYLPREDLEALIVALHQVSRDRLPFLVAAAGLPSVLGKMGDAKSYSERLFEYRVIHSLDEEDARAALREPAEAQGVRFRPEAADRILRETSGYPYFLQAFGREAWNLAPGPDAITPEDAEAGIPLAVAQLDAGFFRVRYDRVSPEEQALLLALASLGKGPYRSEEAAAALGSAPAEFEARFETLEKRGLCFAPRSGEVAFTVPGFHEFLLREAPRPLARPTDRPTDRPPARPTDRLRDRLTGPTEGPASRAG